MQDKRNDRKGKIKIKLNNISKKTIILIILSVLFASCIITFAIQGIRQIQIKKLENEQLISYTITKQIKRGQYQILVKINNEKGIETIKYTKEGQQETILQTHGRKTVGIDYIVEDQGSYDFKIKLIDSDEITQTIYFERPRIKGNYILDHGIYVNEPDLTGYNSNYTRYLNLVEQESESNEVILEPGNWINKEKPSNWYNYSKSEWANIYVENNGQEIYYVWIPRYCFKLNYDTERADIKFLDVYDNYMDEDGNVTTWNELEQQGYQIPEAFEWNDTIIPGYWANKYTAGERDIYNLDFQVIATKEKIRMKEISNNTSDTIAKYTYAINGQILNESTTPEDFDYEINTENTNIVNITALNANNEIIGSMTKECKQAKVNYPDISGFDKDNTFYVTYDENDEEHSTIPINRDAPADWYDYAESKWANIVTRNNGLEVYYTWIPRYEFKLDQTSQRANINFIEGTSTTASVGYQIPEAFWFDKNGDGVQQEEEQLSGYWAMKYTAGTESALLFDTEVAATSNSIRTKGVIGTAVGSGQIYNYYINGEYKGQKTNASDSFEFTDLNANTKYTILVEIRDSATNKHLGAVNKTISTVDANKPDLTGFNDKNTENTNVYAYYVLYDNDGNEVIGEKILKDGSNSPSNWYNYSQSIWANIVVTDGQIIDGKIENATLTTYYTWIPRYEFMLTSSNQINPAGARSEVRFVSGTSNDTDIGYQIPEAFWFDKNGDGNRQEDEELTGYWAMKYTVGE